MLACSTIADGTITAMDIKKAERASGVLAIITHENLQTPPGYKPAVVKETLAPAKDYKVFADNVIRFKDIPHIEAFFVNKPDPYLNPIGSKGMGEVTMIGFPAAVASAVYHATGKRIRALPITPDKLI